MAPIQPPDTSSSPLHIERISQYVPVPPSALPFAHPALCAEIYSPLLLSYFPPARGIVLAYEHVVLSADPPRSHIPSASSSRKRKRHHHHRHHHDSQNQHNRRRAEAADSDASDVEEDTERGEEEVLARQIDEYAAPHVWATASLLVWRPGRDQPVRAALTHASATHVTLAHLNTFAISVLRERVPEDWTWQQESAGAGEKEWDGRVVEKAGWWVDGEGVRVEVGREMWVWIVSWEAKVEGGRGRGVLGVVGSLRGAEDGRGEEAD